MNVATHNRKNILGWAILVAPLLGMGISAGAAQTNQVPAITSASGTTFTVGAAGTFLVTATGSPAPTLSQTGTLPTGVSFNAATGVLSGTPATGTGGIYPITFTAENSVTPNATQSFTLTVNERPAFTVPHQATFRVGTASTFTVMATGFPVPAISASGAWPAGVTFNPVTDVLSGTPVPGTGGIYNIALTAQNGAGSAYEIFTVFVDEPAAITSANSAVFATGTPGSFTVTATGFPAPVLSESGTLPAGLTFNASSGLLSGTPTAGTGGTYPITFREHNGIGPDALQSFTLTVNQAPSITTQPASQAVTASQTAAFSVVATGTVPLSYQWRRNGTALSGATSASYTTSATTASDNGAQFTVVISNAAGSITSNAAMLTVNVPPSIAIQPASQTVTAGQTAAFSVVATGTAPLSYQWRKNGTAISGATSSSYTTPATTISDNGAQFTVAVTNAAGSITSNAATLTVNAASVAPSITTQPASRSVTAGQTASFSVSVSGTSPFTYQWNKNGTAINGATSSTYTTPATATSDNGAQFTVMVSNSGGSATSNDATLTVNAGTLLLTVNPTSLSFGNVNLSSSATQSATVTNSGTAGVTISVMSYSGPGFSMSGISSGQILSPGQAATLSVTFSPSVAGSVAGSVTVASNASNSPSSVSLSGSGVQVVSHYVSFSWIPSSSSVVGYQVYSSSVSGGPYTRLTSSAVTLSSYTDSTVQAGNTYYYVVTAVDSSSVESVYSNQVSATIP